MKKGALIFILLFIVTNFCFLRSHENKYEELDAILKKSAEYCDKLANTVYDFICKEKITEIYSYKMANRSGRRSIIKEWNTPGTMRRLRVSKPKKVSKEWIYDYQLVRMRNKIKEQRILIYDNGIETKTENAQLETSFRHEYMINGPLTLLGKKWQYYHDYKIIGEENILEKETFIIEAVPKPKYQFDHAWGRIWISKDDYSILKIEYDQRSIKNLGMKTKNAKVIASTEYNIEKSGIRFPSQYTLNATWKYSQSGDSSESQIKVVYEDYKFFTVETEVRFK